MSDARRYALVAAVVIGTGCGMPATAPDLDRHPSVATLYQSTAVGPIAAHWAGEPGAQRALLVHGTPGSGDGWSDLLLDPPPGLELVAVDRPGFGRSAVTGARPTLDDQVAALEPFLAVRRGQGAILIGHSYGGPVVLDLAARFPERVAAVVVVAGSVDPSLEEWRWFNVAADALAGVLPAALGRSNDEIRALERELDALAERLPAVRAPVVILHGDRDRLVPVANVDFMLSELRGAESIDARRVEDAGHFVLWTHPVELRGAIEAARARSHSASE